jgi:hypothetical protein
MKHLWAGLVALMLATPATAQDFHLVGLNGADQVFVWKSKKAHNEAMSLIAADVHRSNPALVMVLLACIVPTGTRAIVTDMGFATHDIMVVEGESSGCRGNIPMESLKTR